MTHDRAKAIRSALLTAYSVGKAGGGKIIPHGDPQREANLARHMEGSKAPPVLYHGTPNWEGTAYNPNQSTINRVSNVAGFYADTNPETASGYALDVNKIAEMAVKSKRGENLDPSEMGYGPSSQVLPVHMAIKKPFVPGNSLITKPMLDTYAAELKATNSHLDDYSFENWAASKIKDFAEKKEVSVNALNGDGMAYQRVLKAGGYDGLKDGTAYVAFEPTQIKSAVGNRGTFDPNEPDITKAGGGDVEPDEAPPVYYSALKQGVANAKQMQAPPQDWKAITAPGKLPGVRQEEIDYSGLHDFLDKQQGQVSKADLLDHLEQNPAVKLNEVWKSGKTGPNRTWTKFDTYSLPGGKNYKELVMTLPKRPEDERNFESPVSHSYSDDASNINRLAHIRMNDRVGPKGEKLLHIEELQSDWHQMGLDQGYSDPKKQKQIDYHNEERRRITAALQTAVDQYGDAFDAAIKPHEDAFKAAKKPHEGKYLDIGNEAFQAAIRPHLDAYNASKKPHQDAYDAAIKPHEDAYDAAIKPHEDAIKALGRNKGVPDAPYKDTKDWTALALKRVMRHAADNGYDGVTWTTGDQQADRYDLSKQVSSIEADNYKNDEDKNGWRLNIIGKNGDSIGQPGFGYKHYLSDDELADHVGKDMAKKIIDSNGGEFHGLDLKLGGEGMRTYYDEIVPSVANKLAKEHGVKVGKIQMKSADKPNYGQWAYDYEQRNGRQNQGHLDAAYDEFVDSQPSREVGELHHLPVTPSMKKSARLFKSGGMVEPYKHTGVIGDAEKAKRRALMIASGLHKAAGGDVEEDEAPASSGKTVNNALPGQPTRTFVEPKHGNEHVFAVTDPDKDVTTKSLAAETNLALANHMSLPQGQQIANSKTAGNKLAPYVGRDSTGAVKPFLTMNAKLEKASAGYEAGKGYEGVDPLKLEGGIGVKTIGLPLSPAYQHNKYKVCANSASCRESCLGTTSGNYSNADWWPQQNSLNKTHAFLSEPGALTVQLHNEIKREKYAAEMQGNKLAVRMNVLSDTDPRVWEPLIKAHPDVDFYDYTKMNYDPIAPNHHYTYSSTGVSQPKENTGLDEDVHNPNQNWKQMRQRLDTGSNVAMVFTHNDHLPHEVHDQETGRRYRVIDGTTHDYRPLDKQPEGSDGVIVGLRNLDHRKGRDVAAEKSKGFMVHYDPKIQMAPNKRTGEPTKMTMRDDNGATIPTNRTVEIAPQSQKALPHNLREGRAHGGAVEGEMPPEYAIQQFHNFDKFDEPNEGPSAHQQKYAYGGPVEGDVVRRALNLTRQARS